MSRFNFGWILTGLSRCGCPNGCEEVSFFLSDVGCSLFYICLAVE